MLNKLIFAPGINRENTRYSSEGTWYICDKVRFRGGVPEKIGGWEPNGANTYLGVCRHLNNWLTLSGRNLMAVGTHLKFYVEYGEGYSDITPIRDTIVSAADPFDTTNGSPIIVATFTAHGAVTGDFVTFSGATGFNGITADEFNAEYQITYITDNTFSFVVPTNANATSSGGGTVTGAFQINTGSSTAIFGDGWGTGTWGRGTWGSAFEPIISSQLRTWASDNFGQDLIFCSRYGGVYYWDGAGTGFARAVTLASLSSDVETPIFGNGVLIGDDRAVIIFGANPLGSTEQDPLLIRWSAAEQPLVWTPSSINSAGDIRLNNGSEIITQLKTKQEILVWTDSALFSLQYVDAPVFYSTTALGENISIASQNCVATANNVTYWMGRDKFYMYTGRIETMPCTVRAYVFDDFNQNQDQQVFAGTIEEFGEIYWFYPSADSTLIDRYVSFNYIEGVWAVGTMMRTAWMDTKLRSNPFAAAYDNKLYLHEFGIDNGETSSPSAINAYIESTDFDIGDGNEFSLVQRVIPDIDFSGSTASVAQVDLTLKARNFPGAAFADDDSRSITRTMAVDTYTRQVWVRIRGRQLCFRIESNAVGVTWQSGAHRIDVQPDGGR